MYVAVTGVVGVEFVTTWLTSSTQKVNSGINAGKMENTCAQSHVYPTPSFKAEARNYYNLLKRNFNGARTAMNSANYFAPIYIGRYTRVNEYEEWKWINQLGVVWGIQRNAPGRFSVDVNTGLVYTVNWKSYYYYDPINIVLHLRLGLWMGKKKK